MLNNRHDLASCCAIRAKLITDDALRSLLLHQPDQEAPGIPGVAAALNNLVENIAVLVDGAPEPVSFLASHGHFVWMPHIPWAGWVARQTAGYPGRTSSPSTEPSHKKRQCRARAASPPPSAGLAEIERTTRHHGQSQLAETMTLVNLKVGLDHERRLPAKDFTYR